MLRSLRTFLRHVGPGLGYCAMMALIVSVPVMMVAQTPTTVPAQPSALTALLTALLLPVASALGTWLLHGHAATAAVTAQVQAIAVKVGASIVDTPTATSKTNMAPTVAPK